MIFKKLAPALFRQAGANIENQMEIG